MFTFRCQFHFIMGGEITSLNSLSRLLFALLCFTLLSDFVYFSSFIGPGWRCRRVQGQYMLARNTVLGYSLTPHTPLPRSPSSSIFRYPMGHWGWEAEGIKSYYFSLSFPPSLGGYLPFYLCFFLTKLRDPRCYDLTG